MDRPTHVVIVDRRPAMRSGLRALLDDDDGLQVVAEAGDLMGALRALRDSTGEVLLIDMGLAGIGSPASRAALGALSRHVPVVVMGMEDAPGYAQAFAGAGAAGYWVKDGDVAELKTLLRVRQELALSISAVQ